MSNAVLKPTCIMRSPPLYTTVLVNTLVTGVNEAREKLREVFIQQLNECGKNSLADLICVKIHEKICNLLIIKAVGPFSVNPVETEVYVDPVCGAAVLRGADVFACGILGTSKNFKNGAKISLYAVLDGKCLRGHKKIYAGEKIFLGNGVTRMASRDVFCNANNKELSGIGILMDDPLVIHPKLEQSVLSPWAVAMNLPSAFCGHVLDPRPIDMVLDMCAAPGRKSLHLACLMKNQGTLICLDSSAKRLSQLSKMMDSYSVKCAEIFATDSTKLLDSQCNKGGPNFVPEMFDKILLDAPCSGIGDRPCLTRLKNFDNMSSSTLPILQRNLLTMAVKLLKSGGTMVYSTCTLNVLENEANVDWLLKNFPEMNLSVQEPSNITAGRDFILRFDPTKHCQLHRSNLRTKECLVDSLISKECPPMNLFPLKAYLSSDSKTDLFYNEDTVGFFIAKFVKR